MEKEANPRGFSTAFADHKSLIHKMTKKCWGRLDSLGFSMDYEDIFQEHCVSYARAVKCYDPSKGITFSAYMGTAIYNGFNEAVKRMVAEREVLNVVYLGDEVAADSVEGLEGHDNIDSILGDGIRSPSIEDQSVLSDEIRERVSSLSDNAKLVIRELLSPSKAILKTLEGIKAHSKLAKEMKQPRIHVPPEVNLRVIRMHYGFSYHKMNEIKREFKNKLGVEID